ncbi:MAG: hypothetical protein QXN97_03195 [Desulfurococcaceae archaeon]
MRIPIINNISGSTMRYHRAVNRAETGDTCGGLDGRVVLATLLISKLSEVPIDTDSRVENTMMC